MKKPDLSKRQDFLFIVQSAYLGNGINAVAVNLPHEKFGHLISSVGIKNEMCDAVKASYLIPDDIDAIRAADEYVSWKLVRSGEADQHQHIPNWITPGFSGWDR